MDSIRTPVLARFLVPVVSACIAGAFALGALFGAVLF